jgi:anthranilate phosphoribosyltransferase
VIDLIRKVSRGQRLTESEAAGVMRTIMLGESSPAQIAGLAVGLAVRGETVDEIVGMARTAREFATAMPCDGDVLDTCGTGGDGRGTFNISTAAAMVTAACGVRVAKHGNRSASSGCGSADVLEELGVCVDLGPEEAARCLDSVGIAFLFAPVFHPAFRHSAGARRELGVRTVFNLLGPLCNPARARFQTLGVPSPALIVPMAEVLQRLGVLRALVYHSDDGMDELSIGAPSRVAEVVAGQRTEYRLDPAELGLTAADVSELAGADRRINADIIRRILGGERGPARDVVLLNTAAALRVAGRTDNWSDGLRLAGRAIDDGEAAALLERWIAASQSMRLAVVEPEGSA